MIGILRGIRTNTGNARIGMDLDLDSVIPEFSNFARICIGDGFRYCQYPANYPFGHPSFSFDKLPAHYSSSTYNSYFWIGTNSSFLPYLDSVSGQLPERIYNFTNSRSEVFELNGDIRIHGNSSTIFTSSSLGPGNVSSWTLHPYARKADLYVMQYVTKWTIKHQAAGKLPTCSRKFTTPAILFSTGGYTGNQFHDFTDLLVPLYLTSQRFNGTVVFLATNQRYSWTSKYKLILEKLSKYEIINIDKENGVLCFQRVIAGLIKHKEFGTDPQKYPYRSVKDFREFLRSTYSLERSSLARGRSIFQPRMLIISRNNSRFLKNEGETADLARRLGFVVVVGEIQRKNMQKVARFVNSFDVIMGVHGAGLTNMVFLPDRAVVMEIVPYGVESLARPYFQIPSKAMDLRYIRYKVSLNESSLLGKYLPNSEVYRHPGEIQRKGFLRFRSIYLDNQDMNLDLGRFRKALVIALDFVRL